MPRGGARIGAGRPPGTGSRAPGALPEYAVPATYAMVRHRVPDDAEPEVAAFADEAFGAYVAAMRGEIHPGMAPTVLKAAYLIREEVCGPIVKKVELKASLADLLEAASRPTIDVMPNMKEELHLPVAPVPPLSEQSDDGGVTPELGGGPEPAP